MDGLRFIAEVVNIKGIPPYMQSLETKFPVRVRDGSPEGIRICNYNADADQGYPGICVNDGSADTRDRLAARLGLKSCCTDQQGCDEGGTDDNGVDDGDSDTSGFHSAFVSGGSL